MARQGTYGDDLTLSDGDRVLGLDAQTSTTKNFPLSSLKTFINNEALEIIAVSASTNAEAGKLYRITSGSGDNITMTLPASPAANQSIGLAKVDSGSANIVIDGNGNTINGDDSKLIGSKNTSITLQYDGVSDWLVR